MPSPSEDAFAHIYHCHSSYVRVIARRHLRDEGDAEDVVQDVFLQVWRHFDRFDQQRANMKTWLAMITRSRAIDRLRRRAVRRHIEDPVSEAEGRSRDADPWNDAEAALAARRLRSVMPALTPMTRRVIDLAYDEGLSQREIAARVGATLGVVKSRLRQGLMVIRDELRQAPQVPAADPRPLERALTIEDAAGQQVATREAAAPMPSLEGIQVLVVDDDARTRDVLRAVLDGSGADVETRSSAAAACRSLESVWPDVLLADIGMPDLDGYALIRHVQVLEDRTGRLLPAIALTGHGTEHDRSCALSAGFRTHISKPVHPSAVLVAIARLARPAAGFERAGDA